MTADEAKTLDALRVEIRRQVCEAIVDDVVDVESPCPATLNLCAVAMRTDASLDALARVARDVLCWDSCAFVRECGVACHDIRAEDVSSAGHARLQRMNGGRPLSVGLDGWST